MAKVELQQRFKDLIPNSDRVPGNILKFTSSGVLQSVSAGSESTYVSILPQLVIRVTDSNDNYLTPTTISSVVCYLTEDQYWPAFYTVQSYEPDAWIIDLPVLGTYTIVINANSNYTQSMTMDIDQLLRYTITINTTL